MKATKKVLSVLVEFGVVMVALYLGWLFARWCNPIEAGEKFFSVQGMIAGAEAAAGVGVLVLTIAWLCRSSIERALKAWGEWG
jgi:hypothetical protein